ncbi:unnamed protein product [Spirodela intermedia]|uniref:RING-type E3 ubiquitin transferase n=1 Tax=Spirodela intermedia TaxID=51605 RepID=A0A7I8KQD3_SPIIN|nr:unnamed protein product [Spirodela intermedia]
MHPWSCNRFTFTRREGCTSPAPDLRCKPRGKSIYRKNRFLDISCLGIHIMPPSPCVITSTGHAEEGSRRNSTGYCLRKKAVATLADGGNITIYYFAKEGEKCNILPMDPDIYTPVTENFQKGIGQKFCQSSGHGIDLGFFELDALSKPSQEDVFPLVVSAKTWAEATPTTDEQRQSPAHSGAQITQAVIEKTNDDKLKVKVIKQILWVDGERYELREIFGLASSANDDTNGDDLGKECVICMSEPRDTAVMPCRHMCMCRECAKTFRLHSSKCPICRQPVQELMEIKIFNVSSLQGLDASRILFVKKC